MAYLGIDVGTSTVKVGLLHDDGSFMVQSSAVASANIGLKTGEVDAQEWWAATCSALAQMKARTDMSEVRAIACIGNTPTLICVDERGHAVAPALLWSDQRAHWEAQQLLREHDQHEWTRSYGTFMPVSAAYPSAKLRWLQRHRPEVLKRTAKVIQPKDYVNARLTGVVAGDVWTSKGLVSLRTGGAEPLTMLGLEPELAPPCYRPIDIIGTVTEVASRASGVPRGTLVAAGWSDTLGAVLSLGLGPQEGFVLSGTSESIGAVHQGPFAARDEVLDAPVWDTGYHIIYGPVSSGVSTIQWAQTVFPDFADLVLDPGGCDGERPVFLPYILGQRSPVWADRVRGAWLNIGMNTTRAALATAVLEGLAYAERDVMTFVEEVLGAGIHNIVLAGGGAHIDALNRWRQAVWRRPMEVMEAEPVLGAALLAQWADPQAHLAFPQMGNARVKRVPLDESAEKIPFVPYEKAKEAALWFSRHQERMEENG